MGRKRILLLSIFFILFLPAVLVFSGGNQEKEPGEEKNVKIFVSILPQEYFVKRIGGDTVEVEALVPAGKSPHSYEPTPKQVLALSGADILFTIGVDFENAFIPEIGSTLPGLTIVNTRQGISLRKMEGGHHGENDPHVWLGLEEAKVIGKNIRDSLTSLNPGGGTIYEKNYEAFTADINALYNELSESLAPVKGRSFLVYHPSFGYFADTFGLYQESIETGGDEPTPKQMEKIVSRAHAEEIRVIFVQPQFSQKSAETIAESINGAVVPVNSLAPDWLGNLKDLAGAIRLGLIGE